MLAIISHRIPYLSRRHTVATDVDNGYNMEYNASVNTKVKGQVITMAVGDRIRVLREEKGWTQNHLAVVAKVPQPTIWRLEKGNTTNPKMAILKKLALALDVSVDVLVGGTRLPTSSDEVGAEDPMPEVVFRGFEKLPRSRRTQLVDFLKFLEQQESERESDAEGGTKQ